MQVFIAEYKIGSKFWCLDYAQQDAGLIENVYAARSTAVKITSLINLHTVGYTGFVAGKIGKELIVLNCAICRQNKHTDMLPNRVINEK